MAKLSKGFPNRTTWSDSRKRAALWLKNELRGMGYSPQGMPFSETIAGKQYTDLENVYAEKRGTKHPDEIVVVAAHYDITHHRDGAHRVVPQAHRRRGPQALELHHRHGDLARNAARQADMEMKGGVRRGPMHGIPVALKDIYETAGVRTTGHSHSARTTCRRSMPRPCGA